MNNPTNAFSEEWLADLQEKHYNYAAENNGNSDVGERMTTEEIVNAILKRHKEELLAARVDELDNSIKHSITYDLGVIGFRSYLEKRIEQLQASNNTEEEV